MYLVFDRSAKIPRTKQTARKPTGGVRRTLVPLDQVLAEQERERQEQLRVDQVAAATLVRAAEIAEVQRQHQLWLTSETAAERIEIMVRFVISQFVKLKPILEIVSINL